MPTNGLARMLARRKIQKLCNHARTLMAKNSLEESRGLAEKADALARRTFSMGTPELLLAMNTLGAVNISLERYATAEAILCELVNEFAESTEGAGEEYAIAVNNLAIAYGRQRRYVEAAQMMKKAVDLKQKRLGRLAPALLGNLQDLALALTDLDRDVEAIPYFEHIRDIIRAQVGECNPEFAKALKNLGLALHRAGRTKDAEDLRRRVAEILSSDTDLEPSISNPEENRPAERFEEPDVDIESQVAHALHLYANGELEKAQDAQRRVLARLPDNPMPELLQAVMGNVLDPFLSHISNLDKEGFEAEQRDDFDAATPKYEQVAAMIEVSLGTSHPHYIGALNNLGQICRKQRRFDGAKRYFESALTGLQGSDEAHDPKSVIAANVAGLFWEEAEEVAPEFGEGDFWKHIDGKPEEYTFAGRFRFPVPQEDELPVSNVMRRIDARAKMYESFGALEQAGWLYHHAVDLCCFVRGDHSRDLIEPLDTLALFEMNRAGYAEAQWALDMAISLLTPDDEPGKFKLAEMLRRKAQLLSMLERNADAELVMLQVVELVRGLSGLDEKLISTAEEDLAIVRLKLGREDLARPTIERIFGVAVNSDMKDMHPVRLQQIGTYASFLGKHHEAIEIYEKVLSQLSEKTGEWTASFARASSNYATELRMVGRWRDAEIQFRRAIEIREVELGPDHPDVLESLIRLAIVLVADERSVDAFANMERAQSIGTRLIGRLSTMSSESARLDVLSRQRNNLNLTLSIMLESFKDQPNLVRRAYEFVLSRKAISGQALLIQRHAVLSDRYPHLKDKLTNLDRLRAEIAKTAMRRFAHEGEERDNLLSEAIDARSALEVELSGEIEEMALETPLASFDADSIAQSLPAGSAFVEFVDVEPYNFKAILSRGDSEHLPRRYVAFVLHSGRPDELRLIDLGNARDIDDCIAKTDFKGTTRDLSSETTDPSECFASSRDRLARLLFNPIAAATETARRLFIAPDGNLFLVPFDALPYEDRMVIDEYEISYVSTGRDIVRFTTPSSAELAKPLIIASPDFDLNYVADTVGLDDSEPARNEPEAGSRWLRHENMRFEPLPGTLVEGTEIARRFPSASLLIGSDALEARIRSARRPTLLHFATHGFVLPPARDTTGNTKHKDSMLRCGLALAGANSWLAGQTLPMEAEDGIMTAEDIATLDLIDTELVVLSACETARGDILNGEGVFGLRRALNVAGARTIVMSLWKVPDAETQELMTHYYDNLLEGMPKPDALRMAKLRLRLNHPDVFFWAAFICEGDWHPLSEAARDPTPKI